MVPWRIAAMRKTGSEMSNRDNAVRHKIALSIVALAAVTAASLLILVEVMVPVEAATLQSGFADELLTPVSKPTALTFTPDGRMLVTTQPGQLRVYKDGNLLQTPALNLGSKMCFNSERGLLGVAVDPDFATNRYVYLYYTFNKLGVCPTGQPTNPDNPVNRVSRFAMAGDIVDPSSEKVLADNIPSPNGNHNAGDLHFGKDGYLYISVGDGGCDYAGDSGCAGANDASRDRNILLGKVLRITRDGNIPSDNPYQGTDSARCNLTGRTDPGKICQETFTWGLRNPFRMAFDPNASGTRFFVNDVGQGVWEEVDQGRSGADYGWNLCEGTHDNPNRSGSVNCYAAPYTPPIHEYSHSTGCASITGGAFVPNGLWPAEYDGSYLYGDYVCGKIFKLTPNGVGGFTQTEFVTGLGNNSAVAMTFGPYQGGQALYYTSYANGGEVHRITYTGANNRSPNAVVKAAPTSGPLPLNVVFDGSQSSDPDGDVLNYLWDFGDGSQIQTTDTPMTSHTYSTSGMYTATLTVRDASGAQDATTVRIDAGNAAPALTIVSPAQDKLFAVGEKITLHGSATDPEDGPLPDSALSWEVLQHHNNTHSHPYLLSTTGNDVEITAPAPEDLVSTDPAGNYLEIRLTATDSTGLSKTVTQDLRPNGVGVTLDTRPTGLGALVNGTTATAPKSLTSWEGYKLTLEAPSPQPLAGTTYTFSSWSDGGAQRHDIVTGTAPSTYTATYTATSVSCTINGTSRADSLSGTPGDDVICGGGGNDTIKGLGGNDVLKGEGGADKLFGGAGDDTVNSKDGVNGNDSLDGGPGTDTKVTDTTEKSIVGFP